MVGTAPFTRAVVLLACNLISSLVFAATDSGNFRQALDAARHDDWETLSRMEKQLGDEHPLQAYLDFHRLRAALPNLNPQRINDYVRDYPDSPLPTDIRQLALVAYGKAERWDDVLAIWQQPPSATSLKCYYYRAKVAQGDTQALQSARDIWAHGRSLPDACDPLFEAAQKQDIIDDTAIWERQQLAFEAGQYSLMRYLDRKLDGSAYADASRRLKTLYRSPEQLQSLPHSLPPTQRQALLQAGVYRWIQTDTVAARQWYEKHAQKDIPDVDARETLARRLAWYSTIRGIEENRPWLDQWLDQHADAELLIQRTRRAIIEQDWPGVEHWVTRMPETERQESRWQYWLAKAQEQNGEPDAARTLLQQAAKGRNFYAFLAADQLGEPYQFSTAAFVQGEDFSPPPAAARIGMLLDMGEDRAAHEEWMWLMWHSNEQQQRQLAQYALEQQWYSMAVAASIQAKAWDTLAWRFPPAYRQTFEKAGRENDLDPWLAMAVSRRESAFNPRARSPVGASGLMQLMPATARNVARDSGHARPDQEKLYDKDLNIALGSHYLAGLLEQFNGNRLLALAAYNAGPHRLNSWLEEDDKAVAADVWIESIPFRETRDYVKAVLTYRAILIGLHDDKPRSALLLTEAESQSLYSLSLLE
ncbi:hypothetical protein Q670_16350 [Alcanivorax sp. P2S70]|uniref:Lytic murein transglycosylase n=1 Tax=Alcanivorax profundi TaxID=2338368 RepID=A0A418Y2H1_9GAMM|nr:MULTISPECIES: transglycosylase SLT domain-containing protein [Alcanivorax]ERP87967.1 hypothetical protein Q670_16350 [Alcanivorax sp. P2S70]RJG19703.1 lytic murein transglycosylase [Alcanivorax profundi]